MARHDKEHGGVRGVLWSLFVVLFACSAAALVFDFLIYFIVQVIPKPPYFY